MHTLGFESFGGGFLTLLGCCLRPEEKIEGSDAGLKRTVQKPQKMLDFFHNCVPKLPLSFTEVKLG
jgi:hypothetical protein